MCFWISLLWDCFISVFFCFFILNEINFTTADFHEWKSSSLIKNEKNLPMDTSVYQTNIHVLLGRVLITLLKGGIELGRWCRIFVCCLLWFGLVFIDRITGPTGLRVPQFNGIIQGSGVIHKPILRDWKWKDVDTFSFYLLTQLPSFYKYFVSFQFTTIIISHF